jgi:two-component system response regulator
VIEARDSKNAILLVEDNPNDRMLTQRAFRKSNLGNQLVMVNDGEETLAYLFGTPTTEPQPLPVLVLLDLKLPKVDGLEVLKRVRENERTQLLPVVILTTSKEQDDIVRSYKLGVNSYVRKPVDFNAFFSAVQQLGLYWLVLNENALK